jgi:hypothetical protein
MLGYNIMGMKVAHFEKSGTTIQLVTLTAFFSAKPKTIQFAFAV